MYKLPGATTTVATLCLLLTSSLAQAGETLIIDEALAALPSGYTRLIKGDSGAAISAW